MARKRLNFFHLLKKIWSSVGFKGNLSLEICHFRGGLSKKLNFHGATSGFLRGVQVLARLSQSQITVSRLAEPAKRLVAPSPRFAVHLVTHKNRWACLLGRTFGCSRGAFEFFLLRTWTCAREWEHDGCTNPWLHGSLGEGTPTNQPGSVMRMWLLLPTERTRVTEVGQGH